MSKLTIGVMTGVVLTAAVAVPSLASSVSSSSPAPASTTTAAPTGAPKSTAHAVSTPKVTTTTKAAAAVLPVPAPTKQTPSPDPNSKACKASPTTPYCDVDSVRYLLKGTPITAHNLWLPVLTKWGVTGVTDTCVTPLAKTQGTDMCVVRATHGSSSVTLLFKTVFDARYAPAAVQKQSDAIMKKALAAAAKATTPAAKAKILDAANAQVTKLQAAADAFNAKNPNTSVNVVVS
jgi:hypothetical protein